LVRADTPPPPKPNTRVSGLSRSFFEPHQVVVMCKETIFGYTFEEIPYKNQTTCLCIVKCSREEFVLATVRSTSVSNPLLFPAWIFSELTCHLRVAAGSFLSSRFSRKIRVKLSSSFLLPVGLNYQ